MENIFEMVNSIDKSQYEKTTTRYVYVIQFQNGEIKIGMSKTPEQRIQKLAKQERTIVNKKYYKKFYDAPTIEKELLNKNKQFLNYGNEYFIGSNFKQIVEMIDKLYKSKGVKD